MHCANKLSHEPQRQRHRREAPEPSDFMVVSIHSLVVVNVGLLSLLSISEPLPILPIPYRVRRSIAVFKSKLGCCLGRGAGTVKHRSEA